MPTEPLPLIWQKRLFDIVFSFLLGVALSPLILFILLALKVEQILRGRHLDPLLYSETRISRGKPFTMYKFNLFDHAVVEDLQKNGTFIHTKHLEWNGHLTLVGKALRQVYLDELPQLINVLRGEMSLVGPRPLNEEVYARLIQNGPPPLAYLKGGMTGNYQSRKDTRGKSAAELEVEYLEVARTKSGWRLVLLDLRIMLRTIKVLLRAQGV